MRKSVTMLSAPKRTSEVSASSTVRGTTEEEVENPAISGMERHTSGKVSLLSLLSSRLWTSLRDPHERPLPLERRQRSRSSLEESEVEVTRRGQSNRKCFANEPHEHNHNRNEDGHDHPSVRGESRERDQSGPHERNHSFNNNYGNMTSSGGGQGLGSSSKRRAHKEIWCDCVDTRPSCPQVTHKRRSHKQMAEIYGIQSTGSLLSLSEGGRRRGMVRSLKELVLGSSLVFLVAVSVYGNSLDGDFVHDDIVSIVRNGDVVNVVQAPPLPPSQTILGPAARGGDEDNENLRDDDWAAGASATFGGEWNGGGNNFSSVDNESGWWSLWKNDYWGMPMSSRLSHKSYRPLTVLTFRLNYVLGSGLSPLIFHGTNVLIHGLVSALAFVLCRHTLRMRVVSSLIASAMFAIHPIHTEAIAGITGRSDALACLLMLISFLLYHKSLTESDQCCSRWSSLSNSTAELSSSNLTQRSGGGGEGEPDCDTGNEGSSPPPFSSSSSPSRNDDDDQDDTRNSTPHNNNVCGGVVLVEEWRHLRAESGEGVEKMSYLQSALNPWLIASGLVGCSAMLAKETGITILGINLLYDLYSHLHLLTHKRRGRWLVSKVEDQCHSRLRVRVTLLITLMAVSLGFRIAIMNGTFPRFSRQDNPSAYSKSHLTRCLTFAFLPVFNFWLILCPHRLSYDWQMGSIPLIESPCDVRNLASVVFYLAFALLAHRAFTLKVRRLPKGGNGGKRGTSHCTPLHTSRDEELSAEVSGTIVLVALLFLSVPFLPASNLLFPVGFVVAERILYAPSLGVCILTGHGIQCFVSMLSLGRRRDNKSYSERMRRGESDTNGGAGYCRLVVTALVCFCLVTLGWRTWTRNTVWQSRRTLFTSGIKDNPFNAKMHYNYANLQKDLGNSSEAIEHYTKAIRLWPEYASAHNNLGTLLDDAAVAEHEFLRAIRGNQAHGGAHFNLGVLYMRKEKYKEAAEHLEECLDIDPSHVEALEHLGACYNILNKTHEATAVFHKLISSEMPASKLHTNFGVFLQQLGLNSEALTHFLLALTKTSWDMQALVHAAKLAFHLGPEKLFHELAERLLSLNFDPSVAHMLAQSYRENGRFLEAKHLFQRLASSPTTSGSDSFYKIHYAQMLIEVRRWTEAEQILREIHSRTGLDPYYRYAILLLGQLYEKMNRTGEAFDVLNCAVTEFCPRETQLCAQLYSQLGNLMHTTGAMLSAANYYDLVIQLNPVSVQAHTNLGAIYHLMNDFSLAHFHYGEALKIEPDNGIVLSNLRKLQRAQQRVSSDL